MPNSRSDEAVLELTGVDDLFRAPNLSPMDERFGKHSGMPPLEFIADQIYANGSYRSAKATFIVPGPLGRTPEEVRAGCSAGLLRRPLAQDVDVRAMRWRGWRSLLSGLVLFVVLIGISQVVDDPSNEILDTLATGLEVAAWVILWFPLHTLIYSVWQHRLDQRAYSIISGMEVNLVEAT